MNKCTTLTCRYIAPFSEGRKKIRDTLQTQNAYKLICSWLFYVLLMGSKKIKSAAFPTKMHQVLLLECNSRSCVALKKFYSTHNLITSKRGMNKCSCVWFVFVLCPCLLCLEKIWKRANFKQEKITPSTRRWWIFLGKDFVLMMLYTVGVFWNTILVNGSSVWEGI